MIDVFESVKTNPNIIDCSRQFSDETTSFYDFRLEMMFVVHILMY